MWWEDEVSLDTRKWEMGYELYQIINLFCSEEVLMW